MSKYFFEEGPAMYFVASVFFNISSNFSDGDIDGSISKSLENKIFPFHPNRDKNLRIKHEFNSDKY